MELHFLNHFQSTPPLHACVCLRIRQPPLSHAHAETLHISVLIMQDKNVPLRTTANSKKKKEGIGKKKSFEDPGSDRGKEKEKGRGVEGG